jgi:hypothetical protein
MTYDMGEEFQKYKELMQNLANNCYDTRSAVQNSIRWLDTAQEARTKSDFKFDDINNTDRTRISALLKDNQALMAARRKFRMRVGEAIANATPEERAQYSDQLVRFAMVDVRIGKLVEENVRDLKAELDRAERRMRLVVNADGHGSAVDNICNLQENHLLYFARAGEQQMKVFVTNEVFEKNFPHEGRDLPRYAGTNFAKAAFSNALCYGDYSNWQAERVLRKIDTLARVRARRRATLTAEDVAFSIYDTGWRDPGRRRVFDCLKTFGAISEEVYNAGMELIANNGRSRSQLESNVNIAGGTREVTAFGQEGVVPVSGQTCAGIAPAEQQVDSTLGPQSGTL